MDGGPGTVALKTAFYRIFSRRNVFHTSLDGAIDDKSIVDDPIDESRKMPLALDLLSKILYRLYNKVIFTVFTR